MESAVVEIPTVIGQAFEGGFYAGCLRVQRDYFILICSPRSDGDYDDSPWNGSTKVVAGAMSYCDGMANTAAMAKAGSDLAKWATNLNIGGFDDWYLPSRDELELLYRAFKPTKQKNWVYRNGDNPSSLPAGYPYTEAAPGQTSIEAFRAGKAKAFEDTWYWSSTQSASDSDYAWCQDFGNGYQDDYHKDGTLRARAVRRLKFSPSSI